MLKVEPRYPFDFTQISLLKLGCYKHLSELSPTLRLETMARACGFNSYAAFSHKAVARNWYPLDTDRALEFVTQRGFSVEPLQLHLSMSFVALAQAAETVPDLNAGGLTVELHASDYRSSRRAPDFSQTLSDLASYSEAYQRKLSIRRTDLINGGNGFLRAFAMCSTIKKIKSKNKKAHSYSLKHTAENLRYGFNDGTVLECHYVTNGALIAAAIANEFNFYMFEYDNPNAAFNMSSNSISQLRNLLPVGDRWEAA